MIQLFCLVLLAHLVHDAGYETWAKVAYWVAAIAFAVWLVTLPSRLRNEAAAAVIRRQMLKHADEVVDRWEKGKRDDPTGH